MKHFVYLPLQIYNQAIFFSVQHHSIYDFNGYFLTLLKLFGLLLFLAISYRDSLNTLLVSAAVAVKTLLLLTLLA